MLVPTGTGDGRREAGGQVTAPTGTTPLPAPPAVPSNAFRTSEGACWSAMQRRPGVYPPGTRGRPTARMCINLVLLQQGLGSLQQIDSQVQIAGEADPEEVGQQQRAGGTPDAPELHRRDHDQQQ